MLQERPDGDAGGDICGVNRNTANRYYGLLCKAILSESIREARQEIGEYELDESYFGARRVRGKRGRVAAGKTPVFGLLKHGEKVFVTVVPDCPQESLMPIIKGLILEQSTIYTDGWRAYDGLVLRRLRALPRVAGDFAANTTARMSLRGERATSTASRTCKPAVCVELRQEAACEVQQLQLDRVRATLERVRTRNEVSSSGDTTTATTTCWLLSRGCTGKRILIREYLG